MSRTTQPWMLYVALLAAASTISGCVGYRSDVQSSDIESGAVVSGARPASTTVNTAESGLLLQEGAGGYTWNRSGPRQAMPQVLAEAQELRLRVKELAAQLLEMRPNEALAGLVALPTSFVNLNDFNDTSPLGRYMAEAMFHEFNTRGMAVREYRLDGKIHLREMQGEFALTRSLPPLSTNQSWSAVLVGTYLHDGNAFFVNVRLVRPADGMVLRTGQIVFAGNTLLAELVAKPKLPPFSTGTLRIVGPGSSYPTAARTSSKRRGG